MIYTVTFNPALDYVVSADHFVFGSLNRASEETISCGGKGINVSVVLKNLGIQSRALGFIAGFTGEEIRREAKEVLGLDTGFIRVAEGLSRIDVKLLSEGRKSEINGQGPKVSEDDLAELMAKLAKLGSGDILVLSGSVPQGVNDDAYARIMTLLRDRQVNVIVDAGGALLTATFAHHPFLVKPYPEELRELFEKVPSTAAEFAAAAKELQNQGARNVLLDMGELGVLLADENGRTHQVGRVPVTAVNDVGRHDSIVAGFIAGYLDGHDYEKALRMAAAAGYAARALPGLATKEKVEEILERM